MSITLSQNDPLEAVRGGLARHARTIAFRWVAGVTAILCLPLCPAAAQRPGMEEKSEQVLQRFPGADLNKDAKLTVDEVREFRRTPVGLSVPISLRGQVTAEHEEQLHRLLLIGDSVSPEPTPGKQGRLLLEETFDADTLPEGWSPKDKRAAVIFFYGGGCSGGTVFSYDEQAEYFANCGVVAGMADYRVRTRHGVMPDKCLEDARGTVRWIRSKSGGQGVNPGVYSIICEEMFVRDLVNDPEYISALSEPKFNTLVYPGGSARALIGANLHGEALPGDMRLDVESVYQNSAHDSSTPATEPATVDTFTGVKRLRTFGLEPRSLTLLTFPVAGGKTSTRAGTDPNPVFGLPKAVTGSTGLTLVGTTEPAKPLTDMSAEDSYRGEDGGLYGGGRNTPPEGHFKAAMAEAAKIQPMDGDGAPSPNGKIVLMTHGMSNTTMESQRFIELANANPTKNPAVVLVDGAQGGMDSRKWVEDTHTRSGASPWDRLGQRIRAAEATPLQVQVIWMKHALALKNDARMRELASFPNYARQLQRDMAELAVMLKKRYPNLRLIYLSSRSYGGYAVTPLNPEPYAYESAFGVRWLIQDQINGAESLDYTEGKAPLLLWGPYLWADGEKGRKLDDLVYLRQDFREDGTHPSDSGQQKIAEQLLKFFTSDLTAKSWFVKH